MHSADADADDDAEPNLGEPNPAAELDLFGMGAIDLGGDDDIGDATDYCGARNENNKRSVSTGEVAMAASLSPTPSPSPSPMSPSSSSGSIGSGGALRTSSRPRLLLRHSSSTPLPTNPALTPPELLSVPSTPSADLTAFCQRLRFPGQPHYTTIEPFRNPERIASNSITHEPSTMDQVVGMEAAFALLTEHVRKPLAYPDAFACHDPILFLEGPSGVGFRTALRAFCNAPDNDGAFRLNLITYRFLSQSELMPGSSFFTLLLQLAWLLTPCVLLVHRPFGRLGNKREEAATPLRMLAEAYIPYRERRAPSGLPLFWLVFVDDVDAAPGSICPVWAISDRSKRCCVSAMTPEQKQHYLRLHVGIRLARLVDVPASADQMSPDIAALLAHYHEELMRVLAANQRVFATASVRDLNLYVNYLFSLPTRRLSVEQLFRMRTNPTPDAADTYQILPSVELGDFDQAVLGITAAHCQIGERIAAHASNELAIEQQARQRFAQQFH
jgi:hypothetical protein